MQNWHTEGLWSAGNSCSVNVKWYYQICLSLLNKEMIKCPKRQKSLHGTLHAWEGRWEEVDLQMYYEDWCRGCRGDVLRQTIPDIISRNRNAYSSTVERQWMTLTLLTVKIDEHWSSPLGGVHEWDRWMLIACRDHSLMTWGSCHHKDQSGTTCLHSFCVAVLFFICFSLYMHNNLFGLKVPLKFHQLLSLFSVMHPMMECCCINDMSP